MTRTEVIDALSQRMSCDKREAKQFLEVLTELIENTIRQGGEVPLKGLGKFKVQNRKARVGRNPLSGQEIQIPAKTVVKFTLAKSLKDLITT